MIFYSVIFYLYRRTLRLFSSCSLFERKKWILLDNYFNDNSDLNDNLYLFEFMLKNKTKNAYYMISKNHMLYKELKQKYPKNIIVVNKKFLSLNFMWHLLQTKYILDSFQIFSSKLRLGSIFCNSKIHYIYTQHGVNFFKKYFLENTDSLSDENFNAIIFSNLHEKSYYETIYNYPKNRQLILGLARWDSVLPIEQCNEKIVLAYFTFRRYLMQDQKVIEYRIFKEWYYLLNDNNFIDYMKENNIKIYFALHHEMEKVNDGRFDILNPISQSKLSEIKNKASLLITDYSSMAFDFMVKDKPVLFYRIDQDELCLDEESRENSKHSEELNDQIYNVFYNKKDVINKCIYYCKNNFILEDEFKAKNKSFFACKENFRENIYNAISSLEKNTPFANILTPINRILPISTSKNIRSVGLSKREMHGRWSLGDEVSFYFNFTEHKKIVIDFKLHAITDLDATVYLDSKKMFSCNIFKDVSQNKISIVVSRKKLLKQNGCIMIKFIIRFPISPKLLKLNQDSRMLGIFFHSINIYEVKKG
ncbi:capsular polysaccharide biosynthesis protein [Campylobacter lari]|uniref:CDP-glycerol glycerophosphotransferase family protein n=1 Tax=Campylobacter lari TaxID=201 RepID=UPI000DF0F7AB|nr:CDP-glycerol glycerophosphotransferase family protein [Campylobacter lari]STA73621.1 capsular polysaccharide biosynthesis protein [Campylobacter lari]